jgi:hypothetical protein
MPDHRWGRFRQDLFHGPVAAPQLLLMHSHLRTHSMRDSGSVITERTASGSSQRYGRATS